MAFQMQLANVLAGKPVYGVITQQPALQALTVEIGQTQKQLSDVKTRLAAFVELQTKWVALHGSENISYASAIAQMQGLVTAYENQLSNLNNQIPKVDGSGSGSNGGGSDDFGNDLFNTRWVGGTPYPTDTGANAGNLGKWTYGVANRCGVVFMDIPTLQGAIPFQHQDRSPFSPFTTDLTTPDNFMLLALALKGMTKDNYGRFCGLAEKYMASVARCVEAVAETGNANWANHTNSMMLLSSMLHRLGMIDDQGLIRSQEHIRSVFDKMYTSAIALGCLGGVTTLVNGSKSNTSEEGGAASGLGAIAGLLAKAPIPPI